MISGYRDFYYNVTDMSRAIRFYSEALGMQRVHGHDYWTTMAIGNLTLGLHWTGGESIPLTPRNSHGSKNGGTLTLLSDDILADRKSIEAAGGKILGEAVQEWGHMLVFTDLDGNVLKLMK